MKLDKVTATREYKEATGQSSGTVTKALSLLDAFLTNGEELTLTQLAAFAGLHKTTALRLCTSLEEAKILQREPGRPFRLGPKIWQLAQVYRRSFRLEELVRPLMQNIRDATGESVSFYVAEGSERVCLFRENSRSAARHHVDEGTRFPLSSGVAGPLLLAFAGKAGPGHQQIRASGHLIAQGREAHTTSVAVPVFDAQGALKGALVVSGLSVRFVEANCLSALALLEEAAWTIRASLPSTA